MMKSSGYREGSKLHVSGIRDFSRHVMGIEKYFSFSRAWSRLGDFFISITFFDPFPVLHFR